MDNEFKLWVLNRENWEKGTRNGLRIREDGGLELDDSDGSYTSEPLDSGMDGCRWHYADFDVDIPENSKFTVSFCSSEKEEAAKSWSGPIHLRDTKYALVQALPGRYIRLKIDFHREEGEESPVLRQVKIYYPRFSFLQYLPAVYQEESASKDFFERFLSIFEHALYDSEETISRIPLYFDPKATPKEFVSWLASWLSLDLYELLGDKNREFILSAVEFYKQKGKVSGIASIVSFLTGQPCCVKEYMNNVFRSYGMEHDKEVEIIDKRRCTKFYREMSKTVDTEDSDLLAKMRTYDDEVHYVTDTSKDGRYSPHVIGLFIFLDAGESLVIEEDELYKIINSFLPVFVRPKIITVEGPFKEEYDISGIIEECKDTIHSCLEEEVKGVEGVYKDSVDWEWLYAYGAEHTDTDITNNLDYRTPHSKIGVELTL